MKAIKAREGLKIGGLVNVGLGIGLSIMLYSIADGSHDPILVGLLPAVIGVALLVYVYVVAEPIERI
jgi:hypothetical protein